MLAVASAPGGKVIAETSRDSADYRFPLCIFDGAIERDVEVSVLFKTVAGEVASVLSARDQSITTPGKTGLWTKADSLTHFAEFAVKPFPASA